MAVPYAFGDPSPAWPLPGQAAAMTSMREFGASRKKKWHAGIDLKAPEGTVVVAMESGRVTKIVRGWDNIREGKHVGNTARILIEGDTGPVVNYAAVGIDSWEPFGLKRGDRVQKGQPIARVGRYPDGGQMLHLETYRHGTRDNLRWMKGSPAPEGLLDPTFYVETARANWTLTPPGPQPDPEPTPQPTPTPQPSPPVVADIGLFVLLTSMVLGFASEASRE